MPRVIDNITLDLPTFYKYAGKISEFSEYPYENVIRDFNQRIEMARDAALTERNGAADVNANIFEDAKNTTKTNPLTPLDQQEQDASLFLPTLQGTSLLMCIYLSYDIFFQTF